MSKKPYSSLLFAFAYFPNYDKAVEYLALAIHKISADTYTARTCLTLKMAYNNARLIVKLQSVWLRP